METNKIPYFIILFFGVVLFITGMVMIDRASKKENKQEIDIAMIKAGAPFFTSFVLIAIATAFLALNKR